MKKFAITKRQNEVIEMKNFELKHKETGKVLHTCYSKDLVYAVADAYKNGVCVGNINEVEDTFVNIDGTIKLLISNKWCLIESDFSLFNLNDSVVFDAIWRNADVSTIIRKGGNSLFCGEYYLIENDGTLFINNRTYKFKHIYRDAENGYTEIETNGVKEVVKQTK
jgi:hypothetical protein